MLIASILGGVHAFSLMIFLVTLGGENLLIKIQKLFLELILNSLSSVSLWLLEEKNCTFFQLPYS